MVSDAEAHAQEDADRRKAVEARNQLDSLVYQTEKTLKDHGDNLSTEDKSAVESALEEGREALKGDDVAAMEKARDRITENSHKLAEAMYKQAAAQNPDEDGAEQPSSSARTRKDDGEVVDAEFEDVK